MCIMGIMPTIKLVRISLQREFYAPSKKMLPRPLKLCIEFIKLYPFSLTDAAKCH